MGDKEAVRLLLVDDDPAFLTMLESMVGGMGGFTVVGVATDAAAAVELARALRPDLVVADVQMPRMDGLDAASTIHAELGTPAVIVTGDAVAEDRNRAQLAGAIGWCSKSDLDCLGEILQRASTELSRAG